MSILQFISDYFNNPRIKRWIKASTIIFLVVLVFIADWLFGFAKFTFEKQRLTVLEKQIYLLQQPNLDSSIKENLLSNARRTAATPSPYERLSLTSTNDKKDTVYHNDVQIGAGQTNTSKYQRTLKWWEQIASTSSIWLLIVFGIDDKPEYTARFKRWYFAIMIAWSLLLSYLALIAYNVTWPEMSRLTYNCLFQLTSILLIAIILALLKVANDKFKS